MLLSFALVFEIVHLSGACTSVYPPTAHTYDRQALGRNEHKSSCLTNSQTQDISRRMYGAEQGRHQETAAFSTGDSVSLSLSLSLPLSFCRTPREFAWDGITGCRFGIYTALIWFPCMAAGDTISRRVPQFLDITPLGSRSLQVL